MEAKRIDLREAEINKQISRIQKKLRKPRKCSAQKTKNRENTLSRLKRISQRNSKKDFLPEEIYFFK